ncbi:hypothetical protein ACIBSW_13875 [Actinoplanes sp. NPDC049668]|uniref:hypothetical protein n=1 Tax=unclassified Actinoplanes TaxID=2626549 RepID=UPI0033BC6950
MFTKIRTVAPAVAALVMLALAAPAQAQARAAEPAPIPERGVVQLSAGQAAKMFRVVPVKATDRKLPAVAAADVCDYYEPIWDITYVPTGQHLWAQATRTKPCSNATKVTRILERATVVVEDEPVAGLTFGVPSVIEDPKSFPNTYYTARGAQPFRYCPQDGSACVSGTFNIDVYANPNRFIYNIGYFS